MSNRTSSDSSAERPLPNNLEAERSVLGAILIDNSQFPGVIEKLRAGDFMHGHHQRIYKTMLALVEANKPIDLVTLSDQLEAAHELEAAGGFAYLSQLLDGVPKVGNVLHYADIVKEKSVLRSVIHTAFAIQNKALEGLTKPADLGMYVDSIVKSLSANGSGKRHEAIDGTDLLLMDLRPRSYVVSPVFPTQGIVMCHAWRGTGKTYFGLELAYAIARGINTFEWTVPQRRRVLYVDGEMPSNALQLRYGNIVRGRNMGDQPDMGLPEKGYVRFLTRDFHTIPHIASSEGQRYIESFLEDDMILFLDNLATLAPGGKEGQEEWFPIQEWLLRLRHRNVHTFFFHHEGKGFTQRGASGREDVLDSVIQLRHPPDYNEAEGLRCEVHLEKYRSGPKGEGGHPFEISLRNDEEGQRVVWACRRLKELTEERAFEMYDTGMNPRDIGEELHISRFAAYRLQKKWRIAKASL
jgi:putative DNA primase/helicase